VECAGVCPLHEMETAAMTGGAIGAVVVTTQLCA
jgi:hypothetical protein